MGYTSDKTPFAFSWKAVTSYIIKRSKPLNPWLKRSSIRKRFDNDFAHHRELKWPHLEPLIPKLELVMGPGGWYEWVEEAFEMRCTFFYKDEDIKSLVDLIKWIEKSDHRKLALHLYALLPRPHAFIKNLAIEIDDEYSFNNSPHTHEDLNSEDGFFIGRNRNLKKFGKLLTDKNPNGVYLVTGFRGMGKTSFVNKAIRHYKQGIYQKYHNAWSTSRRAQKQVVVVNLNLAQRLPAEIDILKLMVSHLHDKYTDLLPPKRDLTKPLKSAIVFIGLLMILALLFNYRSSIISILDSQAARSGAVKQDLDTTLIKVTFSDLQVDTSKAGRKNEAQTELKRAQPQIIKDQSVRSKLPRVTEKLLSNGGAMLVKSVIVILAVLLIFLIVSLLLAIIEENEEEKDKALKIIKELYKRCFSIRNVEVNSSHQISIEKLGASIAGPSEKEVLNYPIASSKEIEYHVTAFLGEARKNNVEFVFVFDELDKIEPAAVTTEYYEDNRQDGDLSLTYLQQIRQRKQSVINIIAGLKNFLTTAPGRFVFIAGREMFDATLADVADRQSSIGSIFNYVFYIESFLKETLEQDNIKSSLSACIEHYLIYVIFGKEKAEMQDHSLFDLMYDRYRSEDELWDRKLAGIMKRKKIADNDDTTIEEYILRKKELNYYAHRKSLIMLQNFIVYLTYRSNGSPKKIIKLVQETIRVERQRTFLNPGSFLVGKTLPEIKDKKERAYLFFGFDDQYRMGFINHLYRPFLVRYGQSFNKYSDNIVLSTTYLFDHLLKFHPFAFSIPNLELTPEVLSTNKTPLLREHIQTIIEYLSNNHLRETEIGIFDYKFYSRTQSELIYISKTFEHEAAAFNFTLDEGYLIKLHIRNELKNLREVHSKFKKVKKTSMSISHLNGILGDLHFFDQEYDDAIVAYSDCLKLIRVSEGNIEQFVRSLRFKLKLGLTLEKVKSYDEALAFYADAARESKAFFPEDKDYLPVHYDLLQIANQSHIAMMVLQEKMGIDGIGLERLVISIDNFLKITEPVSKRFGKNILVQANLYLLSGNLLYFKNDRSVNDDTVVITEGLNEDVCALLECGRNEELFKKDRSVAFYYYGLKTLLCKVMSGDIDLAEDDLLNDVLDRVVPDQLMKKELSRNDAKYIAIFLSHIGDCILSDLSLSETLTPEDSTASLKDHTAVIYPFEQVDWKYNSLPVDKIFGDPYQSDLTFDRFLLRNDDRKKGLREVLLCYYWAGKFFEKRGRGVSYSFQFRKILYVLHIVLKNEVYPNKHKAHAYLEQLERLILQPILQMASRTAENSDQHMLIKFSKSRLYQDNVKNENRFFDMFLNNNISNHPDTRECLSLFLYIRVKLLGATDMVSYRKFISPDNSFGTQYTRIFELNLWSKINLVKYKANALLNRTAEKKEDLILYGFEYLHSQFSSLLMIDIYSTDYTISHSWKGFIHYSIAQFLERWAIDDNDLDCTALVSFITNHIGLNPLGAMEDPVYHYNMACTHMDKAKQLHSQGQEYRKNMDNLIYLEDDINDNAYHFGAAIDRFHIVNGTFDNVIDHSKNRIAMLHYKKTDPKTYDIHTFVAEKFFDAGCERFVAGKYNHPYVPYNKIELKAIGPFKIRPDRNMDNKLILYYQIRKRSQRTGSDQNRTDHPESS